MIENRSTPTEPTTTLITSFGVKPCRHSAVKQLKAPVTHIARSVTELRSRPVSRSMAALDRRCKNIRRRLFSSPVNCNRQETASLQARDMCMLKKAIASIVGRASDAFGPRSKHWPHTSSRVPCRRCTWHVSCSLSTPLWSIPSRPISSSTTFDVYSRRHGLPTPLWTHVGLRSRT